MNLAYRSRDAFFLCTLLAALLLPLSARSEVLEEIHFQYRDGLIWLKVNIAGKSKPLNFLLDSGAGISAIDLRTARTLGVHLGNRQIVLGVNGQGFAFQVSDLHAVCAGIDLPKTVLAVDLRALSDCCERPVDGILGADFFRSRIVQIDFRDGRVRILERCDPNLAKCEILPIRMCNDAFCVPVRVTGNSAQWMRLDRAAMRLWSGWLAARKSGGRAKAQSVSQANRFITSIPPCSSGRNVSTRSPRAFTGSRSSQAKTACSVTHCFRSFA